MGVQAIKRLGKSSRSADQCLQTGKTRHTGQIVKWLIAEALGWGDADIPLNHEDSRAEERILYDLSFDEKSRIIYLRGHGFWDLDNVASLERDLTATINRAQASGEPYSVLTDNRDLPIQSAQVMEALAKMSEAEIMTPTGRAAILVNRMLNKLQAERVAQHPNVRVFTDEAEARRWLDPTST